VDNFFSQQANWNVAIRLLNNLRFIKECQMRKIERNNFLSPCSVAFLREYLLKDVAVNVLGHYVLLISIFAHLILGGAVYAKPLNGDERRKIANDIRGLASLEQRLEVVLEMKVISNLVKNPVQITQATAQAVGGRGLISTGCELVKNRFQHCGFYKPINDSNLIISLTSLYTLSENNESDHGVNALWRINSEQACVPFSILESFLNISTSPTRSTIFGEPFIESAIGDYDDEVQDYQNFPYRNGLLRIISKNGCVVGIDLRGEY
jgi:hypothetical protein